MNAIGWARKNLEQVRENSFFRFVKSKQGYLDHTVCVFSSQVYEDVSQCCQALSQRLGTQPYFFNKQ